MKVNIDNMKGNLFVNGNNFGQRNRVFGQGDRVFGQQNLSVINKHVSIAANEVFFTFQNRYKYPFCKPSISTLFLRAIVKVALWPY